MLVLGVAVFLVYYPAASGPFILDDFETIVDNPSVRQLWPLVGNGETRMRRTARKVEFMDEQPGVYRFEAALNGKPWVYANPLYLR